MILTLDFQKLNEQSWNSVGQLVNLRHLSLKNSNLDDGSVANLRSLEQLRYLNLVSTHVSKTGLEQLKGLSNLKSLYVYNTEVQKSEAEFIHEILPKAMIDFGGYIVPVRSSDTTILTKKDLLKKN